MEEKFISFRVPIELAEQAKKRAKSQHRSLQGHMLYLIENDLSLSVQGKAATDAGANQLKASESFASMSSTATKKTSRRVG